MKVLLLFQMAIKPPKAASERATDMKKIKNEIKITNE